MTDTVEFVYDADVGNLISSLQEMGDTGAASMAAIAQASEKASEGLDAVSPHVEEVKKRIHETKEEAEGLGEILEGVHTVLREAFEAAGIIYLIERFKQLGEMMEAFGERAIRLESVSEVLGVTVEQLQTMQEAGEHAGVSTETFTRAMERLSNMLYQARQGGGQAITSLHELGLTTEQITDPAFKLTDLLDVLRERLNNAGTASHTMSELIATLGARGAIAAEGIKHLDTSNEAVKDTMKDINGLSDEQVSRLKDMAIWWKELGTWVENTSGKMVIAIADMKNLPSISEAMGGTAEEQEEAFERITGQVDKTKEKAKEGYDDIIAAAAHAASTKIEIEEVVTKDTLDALKARIQDESQGTAARVALAKDYYNAAVDFYGSKLVPEARAAYTQLEEAERAYTAKQIQHGEQVYNEQTKGLELRVKAVESSIELSGKELEDTRKTNEAELESTKASVLGRIELQKQLFDSSTSRRSPTDQAAGDNAFLAQQLAAWNEFYSNKARLAAQDDAALTQIQAQSVATTSKILTEMAKNQENAAKKTEQEWMTVLKPIGSAFDGLISGMLHGTETFHQAWLKLQISLVESVVKSGTQMLEHWIAQQAAKTAATAAATTTQTTIQAAGAEAGAKANALAAGKSILVSAKQAAAGVYASVSEIPYVGWILAPIAATAAFAAVTAFGSGLAFEKGGIVPYDTHALVHRDEMVLPAEISRSLQKMIGAGGGGSDSHSYHGDVNIRALDAPSLKRLLNSPAGRDSIITSLMRSYRRGAR